MHFRWLLRIMCCGSGSGCYMQVFKHKPKKHYQRKTGHRQPLTKFLVTKIAPDS